MAYDFIYLSTRKCCPLWLESFWWEAFVAMYQPATEEGLTQNSWAVGCLFLARATSFNSAWALTHPFPDSPVLGFQPVLGWLTGMFWAIVMYQGPVLHQTWFFLGGGWWGLCSPMMLSHVPQVPSDPQQKSLWILHCPVIRSSRNHPHAMTHHLIRPKDFILEVLVQESWSGWPSSFCFSVTPPMKYSLHGYTGMHSHSNSTAGACCGFPDDIWELLESSCNISLLLGRTGLDGKTRACQQFFWTSTTCGLFSRH